jgi:DNA-binding NtrC family response regulator/tetratricopeptide (TPR) repeat protein
LILPVASGHPTKKILGTTGVVRALREQIRHLASFDAPGSRRAPTVLLLGETGTGKGLVARVMHESGPRARGPFVDVNCAAIPDAMLEAELFGFEAGAFTDAKRAKPGLFEAASGGTLFLDEIDALSLALQGKVLTAIEDKRVRRLGAVAGHEVDVKLVAATQRDLRALIAAGTFRADLYHRLAVLVVAIPPLRERDDDVLHLAGHFLTAYAQAHGLAPRRLDDGARTWLAGRAWPGNVRELQHLMERVTLLCPDETVGALVLEHLATPTGPGAPLREGVATDPRSDASEPDVDRIRGALERAGGNVVRAARLLGIGRNALRYRMRRLGIDRPDPEPLAPARRGATSAPAAPSGASTAPSWEDKPVAVLALALAFPAREAGTVEPWTVTTRWEQAVAEKVEGFGGVLLSRSPSSLSVLFGVPRTLEQMPERAVQAALAVQRLVADAAAPGPELRAAVHLGEVRVEAGATDPLARLLPIGDAFALPERLLGHAGAGEVLASAPAARRAARTCALESRMLQLGPRESDRLTAYAITGQRPRTATEDVAPDGPLTPFVGRMRERDLLAEAFARAAGGQGQVAFVAGDAGIGKSRLLAEFRRYLADVPHRWIEGRCASYGTGTPFLPIIDGLRRFFGITDRDDEGGAIARITHAVAGLGTDLAWIVPYVRQVLSFGVEDEAVRDLDAASRRSELSRALSALMLRLADQEPVVVLVEDLHWIDPASEEYLAVLADLVPAARVLLVLSHRSGYRQPFGDRSYHVRVTLPPLSGSEMTDMTDAVLGTAAIPPAVRSLVADKAEGNPFFVEELTRWLLEDGSLRREDGAIVLARELPAAAVPSTIQDLLIARIDRLASESRHAIQVASVIGREFALRLLARITEAGDGVRSHVEELRGLELIYEKAMHPELAYMFKHALTHDVAYQSVRVDRRRALHQAIGLAIEDLYADRLAEHYETLAHHFERGGDWARALGYHERSADKAAEHHANRAVVDHCRQALAIAAPLGDAVPADVHHRLHERLARASFYLSDFAVSAAAYEEAAARSDEPETRALHTAGAAFSHLWAHRYEPALRAVEVAREIARHHDVPAGEAMALAVLGFYRGVCDADVGAYARHLDDALAICTRHRHEGVEAFVRFQLVLAAEWRGEYDRAIALAERAMVLGRRLRMPEVLIFSTWFVGKARCCTGDFGGAIVLLDEAYRLCDRIGDRAWKSRLLNTLGWCFAEIGSHQRAAGYNAGAAALAHEIGDPEILANAAINLATDHLALGSAERASAYLEPIEADLAGDGDPWMRWRYTLHARDARARLELARGAPDRALALVEQELAGARRYAVPKVEARALALRGRVLLALDRPDAAQEALEQALGVAERIGYRRGLWETRGLLADVARRAGDASRAAAHAGAARTVVAQAARSLTDDELRRRLLAVAGA